MKDQSLLNILRYLHDKRGFDFNGNHTLMLTRRLQKRLQATEVKNGHEYLHYLKDYPKELDHLIDVFTINVSRFFRNSIVFECINKMVLPELILGKLRKKEFSLRIWSAGCATGEEPYSMAILLKERLKKQEYAAIKPSIFATDIDQLALAKAAEGIYNFDSIKNVKFGILERYFTKTEQSFQVSPEIKEMVQFTFFDLLDKNRLSPPNSIYGDFDIIICRNVLLYFDAAYQKMIFDKLYRSLKMNGYLILGEAELPDSSTKKQYKKINSCSKIYQKIG
ncbi:MAG: protein-glutamate O-methyltransferase CheR [Bacteroidales bacterium]|nr:protein-glutamate O-methyltransferase CheR [Bacteroidales bacterium]